jgi:hypothetical protein
MGVDQYTQKTGDGHSTNKKKVLAIFGGFTFWWWDHIGGFSMSKRWVFYKFANV